jgi:hypothetical protein
MDRWTRRWTPRTRRRRPSRWSAHGLVFEQLDFGQSPTVMLVNAPQRKAGLWPTPLGYQPPATGPWRWLHLSPAWTPADARLLLSKTIIHPISPINATATSGFNNRITTARFRSPLRRFARLCPPRPQESSPRRGLPATLVRLAAPALSCRRRPASRSRPFIEQLPHGWVPRLEHFEPALVPSPTHRAPIPHPPPDVGCKRACAVEEDIGPVVFKVIRQNDAHCLAHCHRLTQVAHGVYHALDVGQQRGRRLPSLHPAALHRWVRLDSCEVVGVEQGCPREGGCERVCARNCGISGGARYACNGCMSPIAASRKYFRITWTFCISVV